MIIIIWTFLYEYQTVKKNMIKKDLSVFDVDPPTPITSHETMMKKSKRRKGKLARWLTIPVEHCPNTRHIYCGNWSISSVMIRLLCKQLLKIVGK